MRRERPANLAAGSVWLPLPHPVIPGAIWIPGAGLGDIDADIEQFFRARLAQGTRQRPRAAARHLLSSQCWLSWNAAKRAISYGYRRVYWFPDGMEGWRAAGFPSASAEPCCPDPLERDVRAVCRPACSSPLMAVKTLRPKKNGKPKSNEWVSDSGPARFAKAMPLGLSLNRKSALATLKRNCALAPLVPVRLRIQTASRRAEKTRRAGAVGAHGIALSTK